MDAFKETLSKSLHYYPHLHNYRVSPNCMMTGFAPSQQKWLLGIAINIFVSHNGTALGMTNFVRSKPDLW